MYLQALHASTNPASLKSNTPFSPHICSSPGPSHLREGHQCSSGVQAGNPGVFISHPKPLVTLWPPNDSGVCHCYVWGPLPAHALHQDASLLRPSLPSPPSSQSPFLASALWTPKPKLKGASALPHALRSFHLSRGSGPQFLFGFSNVFRSLAPSIFAPYLPLNLSL